MGLICDIARAARKGDLATINRLLDESPSHATTIIRGRALGDRDMGVGDRLPDLPEAHRIKIGPGQPLQPSIYRDGFANKRSRRRKAA